MDTKQRFINALDLKPVDRLPVTTHHVMSYFLKHYAGGLSTEEFFEEYNLDPILWLSPVTCNHSNGEYMKDGFIQNSNWHIEIEVLPDNKYLTKRFKVHTPKKVLTMTLQFNEYTCWMTEHLIKDKSDIELLAEYAPVRICDAESANESALAYGNKGLVRSAIDSFDIFGQPGCWQDAACFYGIENLIMETFDDSAWVHEFLRIILERKLKYVNSLKGVHYDLIELGGGDASSTVISPTIFNEYVAPYDSQIIDHAKKLNQRIVYHTCGGMMPILDDIVAMKPNAIETLTPLGMGGDVDLKEAKKRVGHKVCMIGGFDQGHYFTNSTVEETRLAVRKCFNEAGSGGGFILSPSDHFFDAKPELIKAFADEANKCIY
ncbi:uroporphyrinogen decarboxylase family protein [Vallitalea okinawensis]|uniref:uroporphyrinogen decarboxylase family protein n=1 Tax=Vallitalea okinawensis TaxID=2078660 RepID=UPI000CFB0B18|nr:uroporphyrinogen decarboxylase family protein [Vallitalea okinawensis]